MPNKGSEYLKIVVSDYSTCNNCDFDSKNLYDILNEVDGSCVTTLCIDCLRELEALISEIQ